MDLKDYLGDGVYAIFDGYGIWLHANDHANPTDRIYLEPPVLEALHRFEERVRAAENSGAVDNSAQQGEYATAAGQGE
jgi:hypothetical protein